MNEDCDTQVKILIKMIVKYSAEKILCTFVSYTKHHFEGRAISCE